MLSWIHQGKKTEEVMGLFDFLLSKKEPTEAVDGDDDRGPSLSETLKISQWKIDWDAEVAKMDQRPIAPATYFSVSDTHQKLWPLVQPYATRFGSSKKWPDWLQVFLSTSSHQVCEFEKRFEFPQAYQPLKPQGAGLVDGPQGVATQAEVFVAEVETNAELEAEARRKRIAEYFNKHPIAPPLDCVAPPIAESVLGRSQGRNMGGMSL